MSNLLRACFPASDTANSNLKNSALDSIPPQLREYIDSLIRPANVTYVLDWCADGPGEPVADSPDQYNGCIGQIQRNLSDLMMREIPYPSPAQNIQQGLIAWDTKIAIISAYEPIEGDKSHYAQMTSCVYTFDPLVWILCLLSLLSFSLVALASRAAMKTAKRGKASAVFPDHQYILYQVLTHMMATGSLFSSNRLSKKILYLAICLFSLLVLFFFMSMMSTELVVAEKPDTLSSFTDVLKRGMRASFFRSSNIHLKFKYAPPDTIERKIWDAAVSRVPEDQVAVNSDGEAGARAFHHTFRRQAVSVFESIWAKITLEVWCFVASDQKMLDSLFRFEDLPRLQAKTFFPHYLVDERSPVIQQQFIFNARPSEPTKRIKKVLRRLSESGAEAQVEKIADILLSLMGEVLSIQPPSVYDEDVSKCIDNTIIIRDREPAPMTLGNLSALYVIMTGLYLVILMILLLELLVCAYTKRRHSGQTRRSHLTFARSRRIAAVEAE